MWLDAVERKYIEEMGGMNIMFVIDDTLVTPSTKGGSILPGVTRDSLLQLAKAGGRKVEERDISADLTGVAPWSGYEVGWKSSDTPALTTAPVINQSLTVEGVEFTISSTKADKKGLNIIGTVSNRSDADIEGLAITFAAPDLDVSGKKVFVELTVGRLAQGADTALSFTLTGVKIFTGLVMSWKSVIDQTKK